MKMFYGEYLTITSRGSLQYLLVLYVEPANDLRPLKYLHSSSPCRLALFP
jgi:hypothetical protein